jgi:hypothetical protein
VPSWLKITSGPSGSGSGTVNYVVAANTDLVPLFATLAIGSSTFAVQEQGTSEPLLIGSIPHLVAGAGWNETLTLVNKSAAQASILTNFYAPDGTALSVPFVFVQHLDLMPTGGIAY